MASDLQRPQVSSDGVWSFFGGDLKTYCVESNPGSFTSGQIFRAGSRHTGIGQSSTATPPYHYHPYQSETFDVQSGVLVYIIDGKTGTLHPGRKVTIPPFKPHTFWSDPTAKQDLHVHITLAGGDKPGLDDEFVRNFYGYLSSQILAGKAPNPLQVFRFLDDANVIVAAPLPGYKFWNRVGLVAAIGTFLNIVLGRWIGGFALGLPTRYKVFSDSAQ